MLDFLQRNEEGDPRAPAIRPIKQRKGRPTLIPKDEHDGKGMVTLIKKIIYKTIFWDVKGRPHFPVNNEQI